MELIFDQLDCTPASSAGTFPLPLVPSIVTDPRAGAIRHDTESSTRPSSGPEPSARTPSASASPRPARRPTCWAAISKALRSPGLRLGHCEPVRPYPVFSWFLALPRDLAVACTAARFHAYASAEHSGPIRAVHINVLWQFAQSHRKQIKADFIDAPIFQNTPADVGDCSSAIRPLAQRLLRQLPSSPERPQAKLSGVGIPSCESADRLAGSVAS